MGRFWQTAFPLSLLFLLLLGGYGDAPFVSRPLLAALLILPLVALSCRHVGWPMVLLSVILFVAAWRASGENIPLFGLEPRTLEEVWGTSVDDSSLTEGGGRYLRVSLDKCGGMGGSTATAKGTMTVFCKAREDILYGDRVHFWGKWDGKGFFEANRLQVVSLSFSSSLRRSFLRFAEKLLFRHVTDREDRSLAMMLLLGKMDGTAFPLKRLAMESGCSHLLVLSGMHLGFLVTLLSLCLWFFPGKIVKAVSLVFSFLFVFLIGPKPSLVRAFLSLCFHLGMGKDVQNRFLPFLSTMMAQLLLFPSHLGSLGFLLSYLASASILLAAQWFPTCPRPMFPFLISSLAAAFTSLATLLVLGNCNLTGVLASPLSTSLISLSLLLSVLSLTPLPVFPQLLGIVRRFLSSLLGKLSLSLSLKVGWRGYCLFIFLLLTALLSMGYAGGAWEKRRARDHELGLRIRFAVGNQDDT